jgi:hypothetical protein
MFNFLKGNFNEINILQKLAITGNISHTGIFRMLSRISDRIPVSDLTGYPVSGT